MLGRALHDLKQLMPVQYLGGRAIGIAQEHGVDSCAVITKTV
jgi:hypothetical protein